mgnify:CR=1 FL=1
MTGILILLLCAFGVLLLYALELNKRYTYLKKTLSELSQAAKMSDTTIIEMAEKAYPVASHIDPAKSPYTYENKAYIRGAREMYFLFNPAF